MSQLKGIFCIALLLVIAFPLGLRGQCTLNCPLGDGYVVVAAGPFQTKSPDIDGNAIVNLTDLSLFAFAYNQPANYDYCAGYNCDGANNIIDLSHFAAHWIPPLHTGVPGVCL